MYAWASLAWKSTAWQLGVWGVNVIPPIPIEVVALVFGTSVLAVDTIYLLPSNQTWISAFVTNGQLQSSNDNIKWTNIVLDKNKEAKVMAKYIRTRNNSTIVDIRSKKH